MITKLRDQFKTKTSSGYQKSGLLTPLFIIILYLGGMSSTFAASTIEDFNSSPQLVKSYNVTDGSTVDKSCFPTSGVGVIFQRADGCKGYHHIWRVHDKLVFNEYDNNTATIVGNVIDDQGNIGKVNIALNNKSNTGKTWNGSCYIDGISDPRTLYQDFNGTITVGSESFSVELKKSEQHFILADGAGFKAGQYGFGAWTGGSFGGCTEWFGNLDPIDISCKLTVNAGEDVSTCNEEEVVLTATAANASECLNVTSKYKIINSNTEAGCFTADPGFIFQKYDNCSGVEYTWGAGNDLFLREYDNNTGRITGTVIDQNGRIAPIDILLTDKEHSGNTWSAPCYLDGISGPETFYRSFSGTITVDGVPVTVGTRFNAHFILAQGAGFDSNQYGIGAWTGGAFGACTEWFGNLVPQSIENENTSISYVWSNGETTPSITVTESGEYTVTATDCNGCTAVDTVKVTIGEAKAYAGEDVTICKGEEVELTVVGEGTYLWSTGETTATITVSPTEYTAYSVTVSNQGCEATDIVCVFVNDEVIANAGDDVTICADEDVVLTATGGGAYLWNTGETTASITVAPNTTTTYSVKVTSNEGCEDTDEVKVTVNEAVSVNAGEDVTICKGEEVELTVVGEGTYLWSTGETTASITVSPTEYTAYSVTVSNQGCEATDVVCVFVNDEVIANAGDDVTICANENAVLTATGGGSYLWNTGETTASITVAPTTTTTYSVKVTSNEGCEDTDEVIVNVNDAVNANAGNDVSICANESVVLTATGGASYVWNTGATTASITVSPNATTTYSVKVTSNEGCEATDEVVVTVNEAVTANAGADVTICAGVETILTATGGDNYVWSTGETTASITVAPNANTRYTVTVSSNEGCEATDDVMVTVYGAVLADAGKDVTICTGDETILVATGGGSYEWSTGETSASITVAPTVDTVYSVIVTSTDGCEATDEVYVTVSDKVLIGDFVWLDENQNGLQDDGATGINNVTVTLFECNGTEIASTVTADNDMGESGAYSFEVCPNSGYYYVSFSDTPELLEFTSSNSGDDSQDSDVNDNGRTQCFKVENDNILTIDAGLIEKCDIKIDAGEDDEICAGEIVELTADILDDTAECPGGCVYPIKTQDRCYGPEGDFEVYLVSTGSVENFKFKAAEQKFERLEDGSARYTAIATNGKDIIEVDAVFTGYTQIAPINSPKANACQVYDTSNWEYWTTWSGTITSRDHGVFNLSVKGAAFQMGEGADQVRTGFGASGWFYVEGGDGFYTTGDINVALEECVEEGITYKWTTEDGNIIGSSNQKTIRVDAAGTYTVEAINCIDCVATDSVTLKKGSCMSVAKTSSPKMTTIYPMPVKSGGTLTVQIDIPNTSSDDELKSIPLKASVDHIQRKEDVNVVIYNIVGQIISAPRTFTIEDGKATIYVDLDFIPSGKYILRAQGPTWSDAKNILVE